MKTPKKAYDVAVLGWWYGKNYGSILTYYGLNRAIDGLGHSILMVHEPLGYNGYRVDWPDDILSLEFARRIGYDFTDQFHYSELPYLNDKARTFVVGSDQLWNPRIGRVNDDLFLDFVRPENNRVAYATSFGNRGTDKFTPPFIAKHASNLQDFKAISVRERYAIDTARDVFGVDASLVVDPVFLLPREHYSDLAERGNVSTKGDYLAVFFLDPNPEKVAAARRVADKLGFDKIHVIPNPDGGREPTQALWESERRAEIMAKDGPENFLRTYRDSGYVVTDSYHGSCFAAIFDKPFSSIYNTTRGADRFVNLMEAFGLDESRRIYETDTAEKINENPDVTREIDLTKAREYMETGRRTSLAWLKEALDPGVKQSASLHPVERVEDASPTFTASNDAWIVKKRKGVTQLQVGPDGAARGNLVWCDLPTPTSKEHAYRLRIDWTPKTTTDTVNIHLRNPQTSKFRVVGSVNIPTLDAVPRVDVIPFRVPEDGYTQLMLGALHFTGEHAGAEVRNISIEEVPLAFVPPTPAKPKPKRMSFAERAELVGDKDHERQVASYERSRNPESVSGARARMIFHAHAIEKGLSREDFRAGFGKIAVPGLAKEMNAWFEAGHSLDDPFLQSSAAVARTYFDRHTKLRHDVSAFWQLFGPEAQKLIGKAPRSEGGVLPAVKERELPPRKAGRSKFMDVVYERRSVREFTNQRVRGEDIARAVQIAMQSPSVCNRQGTRVHQFDDPEIIKSVVDIQGGFSGYKMPPKLLLVSADLNAMLFPEERNQPFVDGGLFMMGLLLGLTHVGLGSCPLNTAMGPKRENAIRKIIDIPESEVFISFVAVGHYKKQVLVPRSKRTDIEDILIRHG